MKYPLNPVNESNRINKQKPTLPLRSFINLSNTQSLSFSTFPPFAALSLSLSLSALFFGDQRWRTTNRTKLTLMPTMRSHRRKAIKRLHKRRRRLHRKTHGPSSQPTSKRKVSFVSNSTRSMSLFRTLCKRSSTSRLISRSDLSPSTILATNLISPRFFSFSRLSTVKLKLCASVCTVLLQLGFSFSSKLSLLQLGLLFSRVSTRNWNYVLGLTLSNCVWYLICCTSDYDYFFLQTICTLACIGLLQ